MKTLLDLSLDVKVLIVNYLDNRALAQLSQTCTYFAELVKSITGYREIRVRLVKDIVPKSLDILNYRAGVAIGTTFYMPFINEEPICHLYDMVHGNWSTEPLKLANMPNLQPQVTCASVIQSKIYLVCGRLLNSYTLSNAIIEIDIENNFSTRLIKDTKGNPPRPRHEHSVDVVADRYLVVFGGLCYNSVGENDVFVYDAEEGRWFVPPISGQVPHLRFGHASAVIGHDLYIHGGAQLDNDSRYIIYDDLYKLDCQTWTWYKFEHPEVERYLHAQQQEFNELQKIKSQYLIQSFGDNPPDRFQSYMCANGKKLVIFGGHSIREDDDDNEILYTYSVDEISIFNTRLNAWSLKHAERDDTEDLNVSDMSVALVNKSRIFIVAARKPEQIPRYPETEYDTPEYTWNLPHMCEAPSQSPQLPQSPQQRQQPPPLQSSESTDHDESDTQDNVVDSSEKSRSEGVCNNVDTRGPNITNHSDNVKFQFHQDPDMLRRSESNQSVNNSPKIDGIFQSPPLSVSQEEGDEEKSSKIQTCAVFIDLIE